VPHSGHLSGVARRVVPALRALVPVASPELLQPAEVVLPGRDDEDQGDQGHEDEGERGWQECRALPT
jgi:hypothetical protein